MIAAQALATKSTARGRERISNLLTNTSTLLTWQAILARPRPAFTMSGALAEPSLASFGNKAIVKAVKTSRGSGSCLEPQQVESMTSLSTPPKKGAKSGSARSRDVLIWLEDKVYNVAASHSGSFIVVIFQKFTAQSTHNLQVPICLKEDARAARSVLSSRASRQQRYAKHVKS